MPVFAAIQSCNRNSNALSRLKPFKYYRVSPNSFYDRTDVEFFLEAAGHVILAVYNMKGQLIEELLNTTLSPGTHQIGFNIFKSNQRYVTGSYLFELKVSTPLGLFHEAKMVTLVDVANYQR